MAQSSNKFSNDSQSTNESLPVYVCTADDKEQVKQSITTETATDAMLWIIDKPDHYTNSLFDFKLGMNRAEAEKRCIMNDCSNNSVIWFDTKNRSELIWTVLVKVKKDILIPTEDPIFALRKTVDDEEIHHYKIKTQFAKNNKVQFAMKEGIKNNVWYASLAALICAELNLKINSEEFHFQTERFTPRLVKHILPNNVFYTSNQKDANAQLEKWKKEKKEGYIGLLTNDNEAKDASFYLGLELSKTDAVEKAKTAPNHSVIRLKTDNPSTLVWTYAPSNNEIDSYEIAMGVTVSVSADSKEELFFSLKYGRNKNLRYKSLADLITEQLLVLPPKNLTTTTAATFFKVPDTQSPTNNTIELLSNQFSKQTM